MKTHTHSHAATRPAAAPTPSISQAQREAETAVATLQLAQAVRGTHHDVNNSPRQTAQRRRLGAILGPVAQRETATLNDDLLAQAKAEQPVDAQRTGMPHQLKSGIEALPGVDVSDVRVHRNSDKPAHLDAHAHAQGNDVRFRARQDQHLCQKAWHVVQHCQGGLPGTTQLTGVAVNDDESLESEADLMGARSTVGPAKGGAEAPGHEPKPPTNHCNEVAQAKIKPPKTISGYLAHFDNLKPKPKPKERIALEDLFDHLVNSAFIYQERDIKESIRQSGYNPSALKRLFQKLQESQSSDIDENLGGDRAHGVSRHYAISDKDLEARLHGRNAIPLASRFDADEGTRVLKLHNLIRNALVKHLVTQAKQIGERLHGVMHDPADDYAELTTIANRKKYLQDLANRYNDVIDEGDYDHGLGFSIIPHWKVQVAGAPAVVTIKCEFEVESSDVFEKDAWSLSSTGALVKGTVAEPAKMFSGSNSPVIVITTGDPLSMVTDQTKGIIKKSGVTLF